MTPKIDIKFNTSTLLSKQKKRVIGFYWWPGGNNSFFFNISGNKSIFLKIFFIKTEYIDSLSNIKYLTVPTSLAKKKKKISTYSLTGHNWCKMERAWILQRAMNGSQPLSTYIHMYLLFSLEFYFNDWFSTKRMRT